METQPIATNQPPLAPVGAGIIPPVQPVIPTAVEGSKSSSHFLPIIFSSLVTALILTGIYLLFANKIPQNRTGNPTPTSSSMTTSKTDPTASWKIYRNDNYGFEIKYPSDLQPSDNNSSDSFGINFRDTNQVPVISLAIMPAGKLADSGYETIGSKQVSNLDWLMVYTRQIQGGPSPELNEEELQLRYSKNNYDYFFSFYGQKEITDLQNQILSTFQYSNNNQATSNKKIYGNTTVVFEPPLSNSDYEVARNMLIKEVVNPYVEFYKEAEGSNYLVSLLISENEESMKLKFPYKLTAIFKSGGQAHESLSKEDDGFWWIPTCMGKCPVSDSYRNTYLEMMKLAE